MMIIIVIKKVMKNKAAVMMTMIETGCEKRMRGGPTASLLTVEDDSNTKLRTSPGTMIAEASVFS